MAKVLIWLASGDMENYNRVFCTAQMHGNINGLMTFNLSSLVKVNG